MELAEDIKLYLPQYLSADEQKRLREELAKFPVDGTRGTIYTNALKDADYLLQGDGIALMPYASFPDSEIKNVPAVLLSNTCDMSADNIRMNHSRIMYAPILNFDKYGEGLKAKFPEDKDKVDHHLKDIRKQHISQILFLPKGGNLAYDGIVFFDRAISVPLSEEVVNEMCKRKLYTFSNFGFYLFLLKLSIHFTRIQEKIDRSTGEDLGKPHNSI
jgi:hypothetical protein